MLLALQVQNLELIRTGVLSLAGALLKFPIEAYFKSSGAECLKVQTQN